MTREHINALLTIALEEHSGWDMCKLLRKHCGHHISTGPFYTTMQRLQNDWLVTTRNGEDRDGMLKFYKTTALGKKFLDNWSYNSTCRSCRWWSALAGISSGILVGLLAMWLGGWIRVIW